MVSVAPEVSPSAPAVALVGRGPFPSSMVSWVVSVGMVVSVVDAVGAVVGMVVGVGRVVGAVVFIGLELRHPQPTKMAAMNTRVIRSSAYFFMVIPPKNSLFRT